MPVMTDANLHPNVSNPADTTQRSCYRVSPTNPRNIDTRPPNSITPIERRLKRLAYTVDESETSTNRWSRRDGHHFDFLPLRPIAGPQWEYALQKSSIALVRGDDDGWWVADFVFRLYYGPSDARDLDADADVANLVADVSPPCPETKVYQYTREQGDLENASDPFSYVHVRSSIPGGFLLHPTRLLEFLAELLPQYVDRAPGLDEAWLSPKWADGVNLLSDPLGDPGSTPAHSPFTKIRLLEGDGIAGSSGPIDGRARMLSPGSSPETVSETDILVTPRVSDSLEPAIRAAGGIIVEAHSGAELVAANSTPGVLDANNATNVLEDGQRIVLRPITGVVERPFRAGRKPPRGKVLSGISASPGEAFGTVQVVEDASDTDEFHGGVLVAEMTSPEMVPALGEADAVVTDEGGLGCHAAIVAREFGVPAVVGTGDATSVLSSGDRVVVDGEAGAVNRGK